MITLALPVAAVTAHEKKCTAPLPRSTGAGAGHEPRRHVALRRRQRHASPLFWVPPACATEIGRHTLTFRRRFRTFLM